MESLFLVVIILALYFLPTIFGYNHRNAASIFMLNLLLGWTLIGWVVALIWSLSNDQKVVVVQNQQQKENGFTDEIRNLKNLLDEGILTSEEFETEKKKLLSKN